MNPLTLQPVLFDSTLSTLSVHLLFTLKYELRDANQHPDK